MKWEVEGAKDNADGLVWSAGLVMMMLRMMANPCLDNIFNLTKKIDSPLFNISCIVDLKCM